MRYKPGHFLAERVFIVLFVWKPYGGFLKWGYLQIIHLKWKTKHFGDFPFMETPTNNQFLSSHILPMKSNFFASYLLFSEN